MSQISAMPDRSSPEPLPSNVRSVQPGEGFCYRVELAWGRWRRWWLKTFRAGYVRRMAEKRIGSTEGAPYEILDPRDLKYARILCDCRWEPEDDPFRWRGRIPFARWGLAEMQIMGWPLLALTILAAVYFPYVAAAPAAVLGLIVYFFRDPSRQIPQESGVVVSPADGKLVEITELEHDEFIGGPAIRLGIFLSIFNVHLNRAPVASRVMSLQYNPGKFLNALKPASARENENMLIGLEEAVAPHRRLTVRVISGAIARRIVCDLKPGEELARGQKIGMIKLGSRTEIVLPAGDGLEILAQIGENVQAGTTILARWNESSRAD